MATKKKVAAKAVKSAKPTAPAKKAVAAKSEKKVIPAAKGKPAAKGSVKAAPAKKSAVPTKNVKAPVSKKAAPVPVNKKAIKKHSSTVKNTTTKTPPTKAAPVKKAAEATKVVKKAVVAAKAEPAKKAAPAKAVVAKPAAKPVAAKAVAEVKKPSVVAPKTPVVEAKKPVAAAPEIKPKSKSASKKVVKTVKTITTSVTGRPLPAPIPTVTPRAVREEKKPTIIVAHRRLETKTKTGNDSRTMINYQPDFNRSILDEPVHQQGPVYRYSDEELTEFRELITSRLESARKELLYLQGLITRKDEAGTEDTENRYMNMEDGSGAMEREQLAQLASRQIQFINHLEKAMIRIENKTYGICRVTGKLIDKARLRAVPHATLSIEAKKYMTGK